MFLFYYTWGFFTSFFSFFRRSVNYAFLKYNKNYISSKRDFNDLGYFEKLFLTLFSKKNEFKNSVGNIYSNNNLYNYRKKNYPLIFFFHLYSEKMNYKFNTLKILKKYFQFFKKSKLNSLIDYKFKNLFFKRINNNDNRYLLFLIIQKIFYKRYYNLCSSIYYKSYSEDNLVKLNWIFYIFIINSGKKIAIYDLSKYSDWYDYTFDRFGKKNFKKIKLEKKKKLNFKKYRDLNIMYLTKIYKKYNVFYKTITITLEESYKNIFLLNLKSLNLKKNKLNINKIWKKSLNLFYPVRFNESSVNKHIELNNTNNYLFFYIRKNRIFNKGRYSRNRQLYRTGVYWCLWLNIILVYGLYFLFYRFTFNFGYFWWGLLILFYSTIFSRAIKYNFHNIYKIFLEFLNFVDWVGFIFNSLKKDLKDLIVSLKFFFEKNPLYFNILYNLIKLIKKITKVKTIYFWESMSYVDDSFLRYKTLLHWLTQFYKVMTH